jgi:hypothetical protein
LRSKKASQGLKVEDFSTNHQEFRSGPFSGLGMEARSIWRSIQTESSKLEQSGSLARSDLHYFRARFNYYRLSLLRLTPAEREVLEPLLSEFMELIAAREAENQDALSPKLPATPPFLESVPEKQPAVSPDLNQTISSAARQIQPDVSRVDVLNRLQVIQMALQAPASQAGNQVIAKSLSSIIDNLESK